MTLSIAPLTAQDQAVLTALEDLVRETYQLWDEIWVGFSWRNYTYDHVMRVRNLARTIAAAEGGDLRALEFGATLHDVTKSFDGEILMRDGQRVLDPEGFWINAKLPPARSNRVTQLYDDLNLVGTVHHVSGGRIAEALLADLGYDGAFCEEVREIIHTHLKPLPTSSRAGLSLYDADTIDANIGLPAFYRNVQITLHRMQQDYDRRGEDLDAYLAANLPNYLQTYLGEKIPAWINGKRDDFIAKLTTETGKQVARDRIAYLLEANDALVAELTDFDHNRTYGRLAVVCRFIEHRSNPSLTAEIHHLANRWAPEAPASPATAAFLERFRQEIAGSV
jgi:hypothetical protein